MELKPRYKQTEVGVIPEDWSIHSIQDLINNNSIIGHLDGNHGALYPRNEEFKDFGVPYITANDFGIHYVSFQNCKFLSEERAKRFRKGIAINGDVLFAHNATVGPVSLLGTNLKYVILSTTATYFRCNSEKLINVFVLYLLQSPLFIRQYKAVMSQSTRNQVPITAQRKLIVAIPPTKAEQEAIAEALSNADALIESLEQLIAKKRYLKQGAMQELLTGKKRLSGFSGEWEVKRLGDVCRICTGKKDVNEGNPLGQYPFFTCARANTFSDSYSFEGEAILIAGNGEVGNLSYCNGRFEAYQRTYVLQHFTANVGYLWQQLSAYLADSLGIGKIGSSIPYIKKGNLIEFEFRSPRDVPEQTAIANILSDMDSEIVALDTKLAKTRSLKQGMMHNLLTGRIRLL